MLTHFELSKHIMRDMDKLAKLLVYDWVSSSSGIMLMDMGVEYGINNMNDML